MSCLWHLPNNHQLHHIQSPGSGHFLEVRSQEEVLLKSQRVVKYSVADVQWLFLHGTYYILIISVNGDVVHFSYNHSGWSELSFDGYFAHSGHGLPKNCCVFSASRVVWQEYNESSQTVNIYASEIKLCEDERGSRLVMKQPQMLLQGFIPLYFQLTKSAVIAYSRDTMFSYHLSFMENKLKLHGWRCGELFSANVSERSIKFTDLSLRLCDFINRNQDVHLTSVPDVQNLSFYVLENLNLYKWNGSTETFVVKLPVEKSAEHAVVNRNRLYFIHMQTIYVCKTEDKICTILQTIPLADSFVHWRIIPYQSVLVYETKKELLTLQTEVSERCSQLVHFANLKLFNKELSSTASSFGMRSEISEVLNKMTDSDKLSPLSSDVRTIMSDIEDNSFNKQKQKKSMREEIVMLLDLVTSDNLVETGSLLYHKGETSPQLLFNTFTFYLIEKEEQSVSQWRQVFTSNGNGTYPILTLYLLLVWRYQPADVVGAVLMAGKMYQSVFFMEKAQIQIIESLLNVILPTFQHNYDKELDCDRLLLLSKLALLCGTEERIIFSTRLLLKSQMLTEAVILVSKINDKILQHHTVSLLIQYCTDLQDERQRLAATVNISQSDIGTHPIIQSYLNTCQSACFKNVAS